MTYDEWEETLVQLNDDVEWYWSEYVRIKELYGPFHKRTINALFDYGRCKEDLEAHRTISPTGVWRDVNGWDN